MTDIARGHGGDGGGEDPSRPPPPGSFGCGGCWMNKGKGKRKPNLGGKAAGRNTREATRTAALRDAVALGKKPVPVGFERYGKSYVVTGPYRKSYGNYIGQIIRRVPMYYPSWNEVPREVKEGLLADLGSMFDLQSHVSSKDWPAIEGSIQQKFGHSYNTNKSTFKGRFVHPDPETGIVDFDHVRANRPDTIEPAEWEKYVNFWSDPRMVAKSKTNRTNNSKKKTVCRQGSLSIGGHRYGMMEESASHQPPTRIDMFYRLHTVGGEFPNPRDRDDYAEMRRLEATGEFTDEEINAMVRGGKQRGHMPGEGPILPGRVWTSPNMAAPQGNVSSDLNFVMDLMRSDPRYSDAFVRRDSTGASCSRAGGATASVSDNVVVTGDHEEDGEENDGEENDSEENDGNEADERSS